MSEINFKSWFLRDVGARREVKFNYAVQASIGHVEIGVRGGEIMCKGFYI